MSIDQTDRDEVLAVIREVFSSGSPRDRDEAVREVAYALGYSRAGPRIRETLDTAIRTAVRRGILDNDRGTLSLLCRHIDDYQRDHLIDILLAAMGNTWRARQEAIRAAARYLGFRRAGRKIKAAFKSAINAAIRRGLLETVGSSQIRRLR